MALELKKAGIAAPARDRSLRPVFILPVLAALAVFPLIFESNTLQNMMVLVLLYAFWGQAWNILGGYVGQVSFGHAVFVGIGAYTSSLMLLDHGINPWIGMLCGMILAAVVSAIIGIPSFRLRGHFFLMATVGFGEIIRTIFVNLPEYTRGAQGVFLPMLDSSVKNMMFRQGNIGYYYIILTFCIVLFVAVAFMERSKLGYYFRAINDDPEAAEALGIDTTKYKFVALAISAALTAMGGTFYAQWVLYLDPYSTMPLMTSVQIALVAILGGIGTVWGPFIGSVILIPLSEVIRVYLGGGVQGISIFVYGFAIILISLWQPSGVMGWVKARHRRSIEAGISTAEPNQPAGNSGEVKGQ